jgi:hypothetical protein
MREAAAAPMTGSSVEVDYEHDFVYEKLCEKFCHGTLDRD